MSGTTDFSALPLGTIVSLTLNNSPHTGVIRFSGSTSFAAGKWIGLELTGDGQGKGKNDGSVDGQRYFECKPANGVFVRPRQIKAAIGNEREQLRQGHRRTNSGLLGVDKTTPSPIPSTSSRAESPIKSPSAPPAKVSLQRRSLAPASSAGSVASTPPPSRPTRTGSGMGSSPPQQAHPPRVSSPLVASPSPHPDSPPAPSLTVSNDSELQREIASLTAKLRITEQKRTADLSTIRSLETRLQEAESFVALRPKLQAKLTSQQSELLSLKTLNTDLQSMLDTKEKRVEELTAELELMGLDKELADEQAEEARTELMEIKERLESIEVEYEVLKEEAELRELEEEALADASISGDTDAGEGDPPLKPKADKADPPTARQLLALQKQNARLQEALFRLRDISQDNDLNQRRQIAELENTLSSLREGAEGHSQTIARLRNAEATIEELKEQIDDNQTAEELLVPLTERNLLLGEKIEEMRITIEDLEALKELNDELEENHIETERHLYSQIEGLEVDIRERDSRLKELGEEKTDLDGTVGMFREVVLRLQGEIQNLQALHTQHEQDQTQQQKTQESQAMHSLERKMKSTHVSGVTRRMEMDLLRVEVVELRLRLGIWGGFVPEQWMNGEHTLDASVVPPVGRTQNGHPEVPTTESFPQADEHALQATLFFERLSKKVEVLRGGVGDIWGVGRLLSAGVSSSSDVGGALVDGGDFAIPGSTSIGTFESLVGICELRTRLSSLSTLSSRFASLLRRSDPATFVAIGSRVYDELRLLDGGLTTTPTGLSWGVERRIDGHLSGLLGMGGIGAKDSARAKEFREGECVGDVAKIQSQVEHLFDTSLSYIPTIHPDIDLGERQLGYVTSFDLDLDAFLSAVMLSVKALEECMGDDDVDLDTSADPFNLLTRTGQDADAPATQTLTFDLQTHLYGPLRTILDQCHAVKSISKKLVRRMEEVVQGSVSSPRQQGQFGQGRNDVSKGEGSSQSDQQIAYALKPDLNERMNKLQIGVQEPVNFAISLAQQLMPYLSDVRSGKEGASVSDIDSDAGGRRGTLSIRKVLDIVRENAEGTVGSSGSTGTPWDSIKEWFEGLVKEGMELLPLMMDGESVVQMTSTAPWHQRISELKSTTASSHHSLLEHQRQLTQLSDELSSLVRTLKLKDQTIQESGVKIELMERRMEGVKKQGERIVELEGEVGKSRKQERAYEEAMEQLQMDLDSLEQENAKLKAITLAGLPAAGTQVQERPNGSSGTSGEDSNGVSSEGSLETSYLLEQIEALRGTVRYLRNENGYLKGQDLLREIEELPPIHWPAVADRVPTPSLDPSGLSDTDADTDLDEEDERAQAPLTLRSLKTETKLLYRDVIRFGSSPKVVDLSALHARKEAAANINGNPNTPRFTGKVWMPKKKSPAWQVQQRKLEAEKLSMRVKGLIEKASLLA